MEMQFQKTNQSCLDCVVHEVKNTEQTQELRLTDGMPDIGRVLTAWGQPVLRSKEWCSDSIAVSGGMAIWVLYAPEDGTEPRCVEGWLPFQVKWDLPEGTPEGVVRVRMLLRFADARAISARKLMLRGSAAVMAEAFVPTLVNTWTPGELPEDVQVQRMEYPVRLHLHGDEKTFSLDEDLTLPGSAPQPDKLVYYTLSPEITEAKVLGNKLVFRGNGNLHILYRSEEGQLYSWDFPMNFSQYAELPQSYSPSATADVGLCVTNLEADLDDESHLRVKCAMAGQYTVDDVNLIQTAEDAYSPVRSVDPEFCQVEIPVILEKRTENLYGEQSLQAEANLAADIRFFPDFPKVYRTEEGVRVEQPGMYQLLYYGENGVIGASGARWEGKQELDADPSSKVSCIPLPSAEPQFAISDGRVLLKNPVRLQVTVSAQQTMPVVKGVQLGEEQEPDPGRPSLVLHRVEAQTLWQLAKENGSTVEAIREANGLSGEPAPGQFLLIPVS